MTEYFRLESEWIEAKTANNALRFTDWVSAKYSRTKGRRIGHLVIPAADRIALREIAARRGWTVILDGMLAAAEDSLVWLEEAKRLRGDV